MTIEIKPLNGTKYTLAEILSARAQHGEILLVGNILVKPDQADKTVGVKITASNKILSGIDPTVVNHRNGETASGKRNGKPVKFPAYAEFKTESGEITVKFLNTDSPEISINTVSNMVTVPINQPSIDVLNRIHRDGLRKFALTVAEMVNGQPIDVKWKFGKYGSVKDSETDAKMDILSQCVASVDMETIHQLSGNGQLEPSGETNRVEFIAKYLPEPTEPETETESDQPDQPETQPETETQPVKPDFDLTTNPKRKHGK